ncbi:hypothetical protein DV738_g2119, partial [Chaetothyriales sp. CBS 135597]
MSDPTPARGGSPRGRGGSRGGRGGFRGNRNQTRTKRENGDQEGLVTQPAATASATATATTALDDRGEVGELKRKFGDKVPLIREVCPGWSDEDLVYALQETDGDIEEAIDRISSGTISQWGEVKKKHHAKPKEAATSTEAGTTRGRGSRGSTETRGRGRGGGERSARGARSARTTSHANTNAKSSANKTADDGWGPPPPADDSWATAPAPNDGWGSAPAADDGWGTAPAAGAATGAPPVNGLFAKPAPAPPAPKQAPAAPVVAPVQPEPAQAAPSTAPPPATAAADTNARANTSSVALPQPSSIEPQLVDNSLAEVPPSAPQSDTAAELPPPKDELTSANLEQLPDQSRPLSSQTVASTAASSQYPLAQGAQAAKAPARPISGFAATALKATAVGSGRSASFSRKVLDQQEAVVMPGNHAVEKAAVQFGQLGLNGDGELDVDEDREEPETRTQLPDDSPSAPRASLPPPEPAAVPAAAGHPVAAAVGSGPVDSQVSPEATQLAHHPAPGLAPPHPPPADSSALPAPGYTDPYRHAQAAKSYDPFAHPVAPSQEPFSNQVPGQTLPGASTASNANHSNPANPVNPANQSEYANYYNNRDAYQQYYGSYGHAQDVQRTASTFATTSHEIQGQYVTARAQQAYPPPDAQGSGNNTPAPSTLGHQSQPLASQGSHAGYPYGYPAAAYNQQYPQYGANYINQMSAQHRYGANRPMFDDVRRQDEYYSSQYPYSHNQQFGNSYKSNMYGQPQHQYAYDQHSSSPANLSGFGARDAYARSGSAQPSEPQQSAPSSHSFGAVPDPFGRTSSAFGHAQSQGLSQQHSGHPPAEDTAKAAGPSPSIQAGRPGSAVSSSQAQQHSSFPPQHSHHSAQQQQGQQGQQQGQQQHQGQHQQQQQGQQQVFGGAYPQYGGSGAFGGFGAQQQSTAHQSAAGYVGYGSNAFGSYAGYGGGRGWNH